MRCRFPDNPASAIRMSHYAIAGWLAASLMSLFFAACDSLKWSTSVPSCASILTRVKHALRLIIHSLQKTYDAQSMLDTLLPVGGKYA